MWQSRSWLALSFPDKLQEHSFSKHYAATVLWSWDWHFSHIYLLSLATVILAMETGLATCSPRARATMWAAVALVSAQHLAMRHLHRRHLLHRHRALLIATTRTCITLLTPLLLPEFTHPVTHPLSLAASLPVTSGCCLAAWLALGMPHLHAFHLPAHLATLLFWSQTMNPTTCLRLTTTPAGTSSITRLWSHLSSLFDTLSDIYLPILPPRPPLPPARQCLPVLTQLQFILGFLTPVLIMYRIEYQARARYLRASQRPAAAAPGLQNTINMSPWTARWQRVCCVVVVGVLVLSSTVVWQASNWAYAAAG